MLQSPGKELLQLEKKRLGNSAFSLKTGKADSKDRVRGVLNEEVGRLGYEELGP